MQPVDDKGEVHHILGWENNFADHVLDPIYGSIGLTDLESKLINHEVFIRLRNIKQLGFVSYIYPSATHTRFEHSIGTLSITWEMLKRLLRVIEERQETEIISLFTNDVIKSLRLAALMHDLGHGPFSHSLEIALEYLDIPFSHDHLTSYLLTLDLGAQYECKSIKPACEILEKLNNDKLNLFRASLKDLLKPELRLLILSIFNRDFHSPAVQEEFERIHIFLHDMIKGDIGSDRIDYLLRDTYFTGLGHKFSLSEVLDNLCYVSDDVNNQIRLAIKSDGKAALELMLLTRYFHYQFIAHHRENVMLTTVLQRRITKYLEEKNAKSIEEKQKLILEIALNNDWIEKDLPQSESFGIAHRVALLEFQDLMSRFLFYRIIEDTELRKKFQKAVEECILEKYDVDVAGKILFNFAVESPRIPILHFYMEKYLNGSVKSSVLVHDNSPFLIGLGRAYLENTSMTVYVTSDILEKVKKIFSDDPDFYKDERFLKPIIKEIKSIPDTLNYHDYILFIIDALSADEEDRTIRHFDRICEQFWKIKKGEEPGYDYPKYEKYYDHETKTSFPYPEKLFNALIILDVCKLIDMELTTSPQKTRDSKTIYKPTYNFKVRSQPTPRTPEQYYLPPFFLPLRRTVKAYPKKVRLYFDMDQENRP